MKTPSGKSTARKKSNRKKKTPALRQLPQGGVLLSKGAAVWVGVRYSSSSLSTAIKASVGSWTVPSVRIFFLPVPPGRPGGNPVVAAKCAWLRFRLAAKPASAPLRLLSKRHPLHWAAVWAGVRYSSSNLSTAINASVGSCTVPKVRIFFLPSFCFSSSFFFRVMSPP